ncbi:hypothetical protein KIN20_009045 [Parelaphostrongylus tenuis]|uniref:Uncharacterized protein n=1 Tax=Parelaphostrongylus tenuis TaxID=148309 RepID=A0AAD5QI02_PARTN|nr:hypothetical protein KIN20_009045 [Parelaphostrongylus tenuis]
MKFGIMKYKRRLVHILSDAVDFSSLTSRALALLESMVILSDRTQLSVTLWYRAPELLLGQNSTPLP